jgi:hypothetical protein
VFDIDLEFIGQFGFSCFDVEVETAFVEGGMSGDGDDDIGFGFTLIIISIGVESKHETFRATGGNGAKVLVFILLAGDEVVGHVEDLFLHAEQLFVGLEVEGVVVEVEGTKVFHVFHVLLRTWVECT